jgi:hypothetical protein
MRRCIGLGVALCLSPLVPSASAAAKPVKAATDWHEEAEAGATGARLDYTEDPEGQFSDVHLRVTRGGRVVLDRSFGPICNYCEPAPLGGTFDNQDSLRVRDLDRDGEPEVVIDFYWNGAHCCFYSYVAYRRTDGSYSVKRRIWGDIRYKLIDLKGDGILEFRARNPRFSYAFTSFADSAWPLQIWNFRSGAFSDVTRRHQGAVRMDVARRWRQYVRYRRAGRAVRGVLAAYLADTYALGQSPRGWRRVRRAIRGRCYDCTARPGRYLRKLRRFLRRTGYTSARIMSNRAIAHPRARAAHGYCRNAYGGDVIIAHKMGCAAARRVVRSWGLRYKADGIVNRRVRTMRCRGREDSVEGLTVRCTRGTKSVRFYANVP